MTEIENIENEKNVKNKNTQKGEEEDNNNLKKEEESNLNENTEEMSDSESSSDEDRKIVAHLKVLKQEGQPERIFPIYEGITTIGRMDSNDICLNYLGISSYHAKIEVVCNEHFIEDLHSTNYTHFGEVPIRPSPKMYQLLDGRKISFGRTKCIYEIVPVKEEEKNSFIIEDKETNDSGDETETEIEDEMEISTENNKGDITEKIINMKDNLNKNDDEDDTHINDDNDKETDIEMNSDTTNDNNEENTVIDNVNDEKQDKEVLENSSKTDEKDKNQLNTNLSDNIDSKDNIKNNDENQLDNTKNKDDIPKKESNIEITIDPEENTKELVSSGKKELKGTSKEPVDSMEIDIEQDPMNIDKNEMLKEEMVKEEMSKEEKNKETRVKGTKGTKGTKTRKNKKIENIEIEENDQSNNKEEISEKEKTKEEKVKGTKGTRTRKNKKTENIEIEENEQNNNKEVKKEKIEKEIINEDNTKEEKIKGNKTRKNKKIESVEIEIEDDSQNKSLKNRDKNSKKGGPKNKTEKIEGEKPTNKQNDTGKVNKRKRKNDEVSEVETNPKSAKKSKVNVDADEEESTDIPRITFTGIDDQYFDIVKDLGGIVEESWENCTHLVTDKIRRTVKFLCVLATGKKIVSLNWVKASKKAGKFLDPNKYILKDSTSEKKWKFTMKSSLKIAHDKRDDPLFKGLTFYMTPNTKPPFGEMETIINAAGGTLIKDLPKEVNNDIVILSCPDDTTVCKSLVKDGYDNIHSNEFILSGILKQSVDYKSYKMKFENTSKGHNTTGGRKRKR